jgi:serine protease Do
MSRKITLFYALLIAVACLAVGMVVASRLDLSPESSAQSLSVQRGADGPLEGPIDATTFRKIAGAQTGVVVNIRTERRQTRDMSDFGGNDLFRRFFGMPDVPQQQAPREQVTEAAGSGFIISGDGYILTNNHVVEGATIIKVALYSESGPGDELDAKLVGRDPLTDSALIQLVDKPDQPLPIAKFGDSSQMQTGDWVMAIGNPFGLSHTVTVGVISGNRPGQLPVADQRYQDVLQTDATINPGNSGGPLLNLRGEVIGINTAILSNGGETGNVGIGFAIPINIVTAILPQLKTGKVIRGRIGVSLMGDVTASEAKQAGLPAGIRGAWVATVENGPAEKAGMHPGDVIIEYNGKPVPDRDQLIRMVTGTKPGTSVPVTVLRGKERKLLNVTVEELDLESESSANQGRQPSQPEETSSGWGMRLRDLTPDYARRLRVPSGRTGAVVIDVDPYGSAGRSQINPGDVILEIDREPVKNAAEASQVLEKVQPGGNVGLLIWRSGQEMFIFARRTR